MSVNYTVYEGNYNEQNEFNAVGDTNDDSWDSFIDHLESPIAAVYLTVIGVLICLLCVCCCVQACVFYRLLKYSKEVSELRNSNSHLIINHPFSSRMSSARNLKLEETRIENTRATLSPTGGGGVNNILSPPPTSPPHNQNRRIINNNNSNNNNDNSVAISPHGRHSSNGVGGELHQSSLPLPPLSAGVSVTGPSIIQSMERDQSNYSNHNNNTTNDQSIGERYNYSEQRDNNNNKIGSGPGQSGARYSMSSNMTRGNNGNNIGINNINPFSLGNINGLNNSLTNLGNNNNNTQVTTSPNSVNISNLSQNSLQNSVNNLPSLGNSASSPGEDQQIQHQLQQHENIGTVTGNNNRNNTSSSDMGSNGTNNNNISPLAPVWENLGALAAFARLRELGNNRVNSINSKDIYDIETLMSFLQSASQSNLHKHKSDNENESDTSHQSQSKRRHRDRVRDDKSIRSPPSTANGEETDDNDDRIRSPSRASNRSNRSNKSNNNNNNHNKLSKNVKNSKNTKKLQTRNNKSPKYKNSSNKSTKSSRQRSPSPNNYYNRSKKSSKDIKNRSNKYSVSIPDSVDSDSQSNSDNNGIHIVLNDKHSYEITELEDNSQNKEYLLTINNPNITESGRTSLNSTPVPPPFSNNVSERDRGISAISAGSDDTVTSQDVPQFYHNDTNVTNLSNMANDRSARYDLELRPDNTDNIDQYSQDMTHSGNDHDRDTHDTTHHHDHHQLPKLRNYGSNKSVEDTFISKTNVTNDEVIVGCDSVDMMSSIGTVGSNIGVRRVKKFVKEETVDARAVLAEKLTKMTNGYAVRLDFGRGVGLGEVEIPPDTDMESNDYYITPVMSLDSGNVFIQSQTIGTIGAGGHTMNAITEENENDFSSEYEASMYKNNNNSNNKEIKDRRSNNQVNIKDDKTNKKKNTKGVGSSDINDETMDKDNRGDIHNRMINMDNNDNDGVDGDDEDVDDNDRPRNISEVESVINTQNGPKGVNESMSIGTELISMSAHQSEMIYFSSENEMVSENDENDIDNNHNHDNQHEIMSENEQQGDFGYNSKYSGYDTYLSVADASKR